MTPKDEITRLIQRAGGLRAQANQEIQSFMHSDIASAAGSLFVSAYVPHGMKKVARSLGKSGQRQSKQATNAKWRQTGEQLLTECLSVVGQISENKKSLRISGNSNKLCLRFNRVRKVKDAVKFVDSLVTVLNEIQGLNLIWNRDISQELSRRKEEERNERLEKAKLREASPSLVRKARVVNLFDKLAIAKELEKYPSIKNSIIAALDRLETDDPDAPRHCITSCRVAIEDTCRAIGNKPDWRNALAQIFASEAEQKSVKGVHHYLSGKGAHGGHVPTPKEAEEGLQLTIATLETIIAGKRV